MGKGARFPTTSWETGPNSLVPWSNRGALGPSLMMQQKDSEKDLDASLPHSSIGTIEAFSVLHKGLCKLRLGPPSNHIDPQAPYIDAGMWGGSELGGHMQERGIQGCTSFPLGDFAQPTLPVGAPGGMCILASQWVFPKCPERAAF